MARHFLRVLVACESSGVVRRAFRSRGHEAYSCDLLPAEDGELAYHFEDDIRKVLPNAGPWDLLIAHPPCTYLSYAATWCWNRPGRAELRETAMTFFLALYHAPVARVAVENPVGYPNTVFRKPDQIVHPYYFGDPFCKRTCLWLRGLPKLVHPDPRALAKPVPVYRSKSGKALHYTEALSGHKGQVRSRTFAGIAAAMADQWGNL